MKLAQWMTVLQPLLVVAVPLLLAWAKKFLPETKWTVIIPLAAPVLAVLADQLQGLATGTTLGPVQAAVAGALGVFVREIVDQAKRGITAALVLLAFALPLLTGCGASTPKTPGMKSQQALHVTAESLKTIGRSYVSAGPLMDTALKQKLVTADVYKSWANFSGGFQTWYPQTVELWIAAVDANDAITTGNLDAAIKSMGLRLAALTGNVIAALTKPKAALPDAVPWEAACRSAFPVATDRFYTLVCDGGA